MSEVCPYNKISEAVSDRVYPEIVKSSERRRQVSQDLIDKPDAGNTARTSADFRAMLTTRYDRLLHTSPDEANALITRELRSAAWAAWECVTADQLFSRITPLLNTGQSLTQSRLEKWERASAHIKDAPTKAAAAWAIFKHTGMEWKARAADSVAIDMHTHASFPYRPLWEHLKTIQTECSQRVKLWNDQVEANTGKRPNSNPFPSLTESRRGADEDNLIEAAQQLLVSGLSYSYSTNSRPTPAELTNAALTGIDKLSWFAGVSIETSQQLIPGSLKETTFVESSSLQELYAAYGHLLTTPDNTAAESAPYSYWADPSLQHGPWPNPRLCAGGPLLRPRDVRAQERACEFFDAAGVDLTQVMLPDGEYSQVSAILAFSAHLANDTLFEAWPQPVQN